MTGALLIIPKRHLYSGLHRQLMNNFYSITQKPLRGCFTNILMNRMLFNQCHFFSTNKVS